MAANSHQIKVPLWLDCDPGHDDAFALLLAAHDPRIDLLGVSTVHGNASLAQTTVNALGVLEAIGKRDVPVYAGARKPMQRDAVHAANIHGETGLDGVSLLPRPYRQVSDNVDYLEAMYRALVNTPAGTAWLIATGTLTNVALLFQKYDDLAKHIKGLSIMGGAVGGSFTSAPMGKVKGEGERFGNWTAYAEFNIYCDPEAAAWLFSHSILRSKITLITLDLSHQVLGTQAVRKRLLYGSKEPASNPSPVRALFAQVISFFAGTYAEVFSITEGPPLHDPLAVSAAIDPALFDDAEQERFQVDVVTEGLHSVDPKVVGQVGRTVVTKLSPGESGCRVPRNVNLTEFWNSIDRCLESAERVSPLERLDMKALEDHGVFDGIL